MKNNYSIEHLSVPASITRTIGPKTPYWFQKLRCVYQTISYSNLFYRVDTRRRFNVYTTSPTSYRRLIDVETTSCVYWVRTQWILSELVDVLQIGCFKKLANFARKHLCWSLFLIKLKTWSPSTPFFTEHLQWLLLHKTG